MPDDPIRYQAPVDPVNYDLQRCPVDIEHASPRILIVRTGAHGDILMATPILSALRKSYPNGHITWLVEGKERQSIDANPYIDSLILWNAHEIRKSLRHLNLFQWIRMGLAFRKEMRRRKYDIFISYQPEEWPTVTMAVNAPKRIGIFDTFRDFKGAKKTSLRVRHYTDSFTYDVLPPHRTDQYLLPLKVLGIDQEVSRQMQMGFSLEDRDRVDSFLAESGIERGEEYCVVAPMTTWESRCWFDDRYVELATLLSKSKKMVLIGSAKERDDVEKIAKRIAPSPVIAAGNLSFREMSALIARSSLLVSGDTGPMHVAAAVGTPFLSIFGSTPANGRAPLAGVGTVLQREVTCGPCDKKFCKNRGDDWMLCMKLITVNDVYDAAKQLLK